MPIIILPVINSKTESRAGGWGIILVGDSGAVPASPAARTAFHWLHCGSCEVLACFGRHLAGHALLDHLRRESRINYDLHPDHLRVNAPEQMDVMAQQTQLEL